MKKIYWILVILFIALFVGAAIVYNNFAPQYSLETSDKAELSAAADFTVSDAYGNPVSLSDYHGKPVVINFWATWCPPCKAELPAFNAMYEKYKDRVQFMMINLTDGSRETFDGVKAFLENSGYTFPVFYDITEEAAYTYRVSSVPMSVFVTTDGLKKATYYGPMTEGILENYIKKILGGD